MQNANEMFSSLTHYAKWIFGPICIGTYVTDCSAREKNIVNTISYVRKYKCMETWVIMIPSRSI
jgi:hypothetical protein